MPGFDGGRDMALQKFHAGKTVFSIRWKVCFAGMKSRQTACFCF